MFITSFLMSEVPVSMALILEDSDVEIEAAQGADGLL